MLRDWLSTSDTVACDTPAARAISFIVTFVFRFIRPLPFANSHHTLTARFSAVDHVSHSSKRELCEGHRFSQRRDLRIYPATNIY
jgi:hypothetical protein